MDDMSFTVGVSCWDSTHAKNIYGIIIFAVDVVISSNNTTASAAT